MHVCVYLQMCQHMPVHGVGQRLSGVFLNRSIPYMWDLELANSSSSARQLALGIPSLPPTGWDLQAGCQAHLIFTLVLGSQTGPHVCVVDALSANSSLQLLRDSPDSPQIGDPPAFASSVHFTSMCLHNQSYSRKC